MQTRFEADQHRYYIDERPVPSVTQVLSDLIPGWKASEWYLERGQAVHAAAAFIARKVEFDSDDRISGQVNAILKFFAEVRPVVKGVEVKVFSSGYQYAGTLDLLTDKTIVDYKASLTPATPYQIAGYALALEGEKGVKINRGIAVEIREDGTYHMSEPYDLRLYRQGWLALLTAYGIRRKCKIKEETQKEGE